ncbi:hypothetical protein LXL04_009427 [Taraxacum kok-saghyz]
MTIRPSSSSAHGLVIDLLLVLLLLPCTVKKCFGSSLSCDSNLFLNLYRESLSDTHYKKYALQQALIGPPHHLRVLCLRYVSSFTDMFLFLVDSIPTPLAPLLGTNLLIDNKGDLKLADFGLARSYSTDFIPFCESGMERRKVEWNAEPVGKWNGTQDAE